MNAPITCYEYRTCNVQCATCRGIDENAGRRLAPRKPNHLLAWLRKLDSWIEMGASGFTLAGMYVGSTTAPGAVLYLVSLAFWYALVYRQRLHGIVPLNVAATFVSVTNLWRAL